MPPSHCSCGFTELADETLADHLQHVFEPEDSTGNDGLVHAEIGSFTCTCGISAGSRDALDEHFLTAFTPPNGIGRDGTKHEATETSTAAATA